MENNKYSVQKKIFGFDHFYFLVGFGKLLLSSLQTFSCIFREGLHSGLIYSLL